MYHDDETLVQNGNNLSDSINNSLKNMQDNQDNDNSPVNGNEDEQDNHNDNHDDDDDEEEEPNWELISQHEPARTDVPLFLSARDRRDAAEERFIAALDEANASLKQSIDDVLKVAADIFHIQKEKVSVFIPCIHVLRFEDVLHDSLLDFVSNYFLIDATRIFSA